MSGDVRADVQDDSSSSWREPPSTESSHVLDSDDSDWEEHGDIAGDQCSDVAVSQDQDSAGPAACYVSDSSNVHFGHRHEYHAPVNITQHVHVSKTEPITSVNLQQEALKVQGVSEVHTNGFVHYESSPPPASATVLPEKEKKEKEKALCRTKPLFWGLLGAAALLSAAAVLTVYLQPGNGRTETAPGPSGNPKILPTIPPLDNPFDPNRTLPNGHRIFSKDDWGGYDAKFTQRLVHPTKYVVISHTVGSLCFDSKTCSFIVRNIQDLHYVKPEYADIGYNFLVGGDGNVYEGRGWDATSLHIGFVQKKNIAICVIGNFVKDSPTYVQIESTQQLIDLGVKLGKLDKNYRLVAHNQTSNTISPGPNLYKIISKWPHFYVPSAEDPVK